MTRALTVPAPALAALRGAVLAAPDGELRLRDAGYAAGGPLYDAFSERVRRHAGDPPDALPLGAFLEELSAFFRDQGWGTLDVTAAPGADTITLGAADWAEADTEPGRAPYAACHFSTGLFAGFLARVAGRPLAVLEVRCRVAGDGRCEFMTGSPEVMERVWGELVGRA